MGDTTLPELIVVAGPNGAGKSTAARVLLPQSLGIKQFVNADNIALGLSPFAPETAEFLAGRVMIQRVRELLGARESFGIESTLAGRRYLTLLQQARVVGFWINIIYIWLRSADLAVSRVADRVRQGGHNIPEETIRRRYHRSLVNFFDWYRPLADAWTVCDNSGQKIVIVSQGEPKQAPMAFESRLWSDFETSVKNARRPVK